MDLKTPRKGRKLPLQLKIMMILLSLRTIKVIRNLNLSVLNTFCLGIKLIFECRFLDNTNYVFKMTQFLFHTLKAWQFKYYGRNAPYHASHWNAWNSSPLPLGAAACKDSATLLSENLSSLHAGGPRADDADQQEFTDQTDDTWSGLRHGRQRNQIHLNSLKQLIPLLATSAPSSPTNPP